MASIIVLGAGLVGKTIALDLSKNHKVLAADRATSRLAPLRDKGIETAIFELSDEKSLHDLIQPYDLVVCALPGALGFNVLKSIIKAEKNVADISFFPENSLELDALAKQYNVTAIVDCGVAPGLDNLILGHYNTQMKIDRFECHVGGLPQERIPPFEYKAPFSPLDVIEEYTRPARMVINGNKIVKDPLTDCEILEFEHVGPLESFNSDGLRTLIDTMPHIPNMVEKTLRYPGHSDHILFLKKAGFFNNESLEGAAITPLEFTSSILIKQWEMASDDRDITIMRVIIDGEDREGHKKTVTYDLYDKFDEETGFSSMSRTTGFTCSAMANLILSGTFSQPGVYPAELVGKHKEGFSFVMDYINQRGVRFNIAKK